MDSENACIICTDIWTTSGTHQIVALKCGHLFGKSCIETWLAPGQNHNRCPQCNKPAKKRDIIKIYSRVVKPLDTWEKDETFAKLKELEEKANFLTMQLLKSETKCKLLESEKDALQCQIMSLQMKGNNSATSINANIKNYISSRTTMFKVAYLKEFDVNEGNCRRLCYSAITESLAISAASSRQGNNQFPKYGFKKVPLNGGLRPEMINIHTGPIRDMVINKYDSTIASVSLDKTVKITSVMTKETHHSATLQTAPHSVHFCEDRAHLLFIGLNGGGISVRDDRKFNEDILSLNAPSQMPVYSLSTIEYRGGGENEKKIALLCTTPDTCSLFTFTNGADLASSDYKVSKLPLEYRFASTSFDSKSGLSLISCRPSPKNDKMTHLVLSFMEDSTSGLTPNIVNIFEGGNVSTVLPHTKLYTNPLNEENVIICTGDEASKGAIFWDYNSSQNSLNTAKIIQSPVFDIEMFNDPSMNGHTISCLSENIVKIYKLSR